MRYVINYSRVTIDCDRLVEHISDADRFGDGFLFHHLYKNNRGEICTHLSEHNTMPLDDIRLKRVD